MMSCTISLEGDCRSEGKRKRRGSGEGRGEGREERKKRAMINLEILK